MRIEEERMLNLLDELKNVCEQNNIDYYLIGSELLCSVRKKRPFNCEADICIMSDDIEHILSILGKNSDRVIEKVSADQNGKSEYIRYVDKNTLLIRPELINVVKEFGIAINIHLIKAIFNNGMIPSSPSSIIGTLDIPCVGSFPVKAGYCYKKSFVRIDEREYTTFSEPEEYLKFRFGFDFYKCPVKGIAEQSDIIVDVSVPYSEVIDDILEISGADGEYAASSEKFMDIYHNSYAKLAEEEKKINDIVFLVQSKIFLWKKYYYIKDNITELYNKKRFDELFLIFSDIIEHVEKHLEFRNIPVFDKDIWDVFYKVLDKEKEYDLLKKISDITDSEALAGVNEKLLKDFLGKECEEKMELRIFEDDL